MADEPVWTSGDKAVAGGLAAAIFAGVGAVIGSLVKDKMDKENREASK
jgi:hypothetical protein